MKPLIPWLALGAAISVPLWLQDPYLLNAFITTGIFIIAAMSLNLLLGYTGQLSLGHVAFFGIGAYTSALVTLGFDAELIGGFRAVHDPSPPWLGFIMAIVAAGLCGYLVGKLSFRVRGAYFVIVTISFAEVVRLVALNWVELTQGPLALTNIPPMSAGISGIGTFEFYSKQSNYYLVLGVLSVCYVIISRIVHSRAGRAMIALKENESLAVSAGIDVTSYLVLAAVISAAIAGAAGSLYAHYLKIIDPDVFLFLYTVTMVIMVITGGKGTLAGPIVGGLIFGFIPVAARRYAAPEVQWILYGTFMILIVFLLPKGIVPAVQNRFGSKRVAEEVFTGEVKAQDAP
jgi:branched-chain amino acid transport system permease protein